METSAKPFQSGHIAPARSRWRRWLWLGLACCSLSVGALGVLLPGLPSVEFVVLAAWAASRGSPRLHHWIENHRLFGGLLRSWRSGRISRRGKLFATLAMGLSVAVAILCIDHLLSLALTVTGIGCGIAWIWSRPEQE